jgi:signal transduction histidine kinase
LQYCFESAGGVELSRQCRIAAPGNRKCFVRNAIRYSPSEPTVEVKLERGANYAQIAIRDFGPGIPEELKDRIFKPFFRVDASRDERTGGLVHGLAITLPLYAEPR